MISPILVIDICGTLYQSNTTFDFIKFHFGTSKRYKIVDYFRNKRLFNILNHLWFRMTGVDIMRRELIKILKGHSHEELIQRAEVFYQKYLLNKRNLKCFELINYYRANNARLILVSATLDFIALKVSEKECIPDYIATTLSYTNGVCDGKIKNDLLRGKVDMAVKETQNNNFDVLTDNYTDCDIINISSHAYLVQYANKKNKWYKYLCSETLNKCEQLCI